MKEETKYTIILMLVAIIWGSGFIATQLGLDSNFSAPFIIFARFFVATCIFGIWFRKEIPKMNKKDIQAGLIVGIALFSGFILQTYGLEGTTPTVNAFITALNVVFVPFLVWMIFRKRPPIKIFLGAFASLVGVTILSMDISETGFTLQGLLSGFDVSTMGMGELLTLLCALGFAFHIVSNGHFVKKVNVNLLVFNSMFVTMVLAFITFIIFDGNFTQFIPTKGHLSLLYLGVFSTSVAFFLQTIAQKHISSSKVSLILVTESLFAGVFSILLGFENITSNMIVGGGLILVAVILVEVDFSKKSVKKEVV